MPLQHCTNKPAMLVSHGVMRADVLVQPVMNTEVLVPLTPHSHYSPNPSTARDYPGWTAVQTDQTVPCRAQHHFNKWAGSDKPGMGCSVNEFKLLDSGSH